MWKLVPWYYIVPGSHPGTETTNREHSQKVILSVPVMHGDVLGILYIKLSVQIPKHCLCAIEASISCISDAVGLVPLPRGGL